MNGGDRIAKKIIEGAQSVKQTNMFKIEGQGNKISSKPTYSGCLETIVDKKV